MSFWNRFEFNLLAHTIDLSDRERAEAVDLLWNNFINEYLEVEMGSRQARRDSRASGHH